MVILPDLNNTTAEKFEKPKINHWIESKKYSVGI